MKKSCLLDTNDIVDLLVKEIDGCAFGKTMIVRDLVATKTGHFVTLECFRRIRRLNRYAKAD